MPFNQRQLAELITEAQEDEVGLWMIRKTVSDEMGITEPGELRKETLLCVEQLLNTGKVRAGTYRPGPQLWIDVWDMDTTSIISRIDSEWEQVGNEPYIVFIGHDQPYYRSLLDKPPDESGNTGSTSQ